MGLNSRMKKLNYEDVLQRVCGSSGPHRTSLRWSF